MNDDSMDSRALGCAAIMLAAPMAVVFVGWVLLATLWAMPDATSPFAPAEVSRAMVNLLFD